MVAMFAGKRVRGLALAALGAVTMLGAGGVLHPTPAHAWWRAGVWYGPPAYYGPRPYPYYAPRPYYVPPPVYIPPPPVYYAPPPPVYYAPPPPPVSYAPARSCFTPVTSCPMEVPRAPGSACYCSTPAGQSWGKAH